MRKLTWRSAAALTLVICFSSIGVAQTSGRFASDYAGPLDSFKPASSSTHQRTSYASATAPRYRVARAAPSRKVRVTSTVVGRQSNEDVFEVAREGFTPQWGSRVQSLAPPNPLRVQAAGIQEPQSFRSPTMSREPASSFESVEPTFTGQITQGRNFVESQRETMDAAQYQRPMRFASSRSRQRYNVDHIRLYNPLEGPQLNLQGGPTIDFGSPGCDEWAGFCGNVNFPCNGLKANPGHLGLPWLGSQDACDKRDPVFKGRRGCGCKECQAHSCETCGQ